MNSFPIGLNTPSKSVISSDREALLKIYLILLSWIPEPSLILIINFLKSCSCEIVYIDSQLQEYLYLQETLARYLAPFFSKNGQIDFCCDVNTQSSPETIRFCF